MKKLITWTDLTPEERADFAWHEAGHVILALAVSHRFEYVELGIAETETSRYVGMVEYGTHETYGKPAERVARTVGGAAGQLLRSEQHAQANHDWGEVVRLMSGGDESRAGSELSEIGFYVHFKRDVIRLATWHAYQNLQQNLIFIETLAGKLLELANLKAPARMTFDQVVQLLEPLQDAGNTFYYFCNNTQLIGGSP